jgi:hypothetical protein
LTSSRVLIINNHAEENLERSEKQSQLQTPILINLMKKYYYLLTGLIASTAVLFASNALADSAATIFGYPATTLVTYDNASGSYPVISAVLSQPGSGDGYTYTTYSFLAQDSTGSLDIYSPLTGLGYTPTVGDAISVSGTYSPYHQIPEIATITSISLHSIGNGVSSPGVYTVAQLTNSGTGTIPQSLAGQLVTLDNVSLYTDSAATIPVSGNFAVHANVALYAKDGTGIIEIYDWASSYSTCGALGGTPEPTGLVDITGFVSQSSTFPPEMTPFSITQVPEPTALSLCGAGALLALIFRLRRKA